MHHISFEHVKAHEHVYLYRHHLITLVDHIASMSIDTNDSDTITSTDVPSIQPQTILSAVMLQTLMNHHDEMSKKDLKNDVSHYAMQHQLSPSNITAGLYQLVGSNLIELTQSSTVRL
jgi:hypothetical protein